MGEDAGDVATEYAPPSPPSQPPPPGVDSVAVQEDDAELRIGDSVIQRIEHQWKFRFRGEIGVIVDAPPRLRAEARSPGR